MKPESIITRKIGGDEADSWLEGSSSAGQLVAGWRGADYCARVQGCSDRAHRKSADRSKIASKLDTDRLPESYEPVQNHHGD